MSPSNLLMVLLAGVFFVMLATAGLIFKVVADALGMGFWKLVILVAGYLSRRSGEEEEDEGE